MLNLLAIIADAAAAGHQHFIQSNSNTAAAAPAAPAAATAGNT